MFFRNLTLFRFSPAVATDLNRLDEVLAGVARVDYMHLDIQGSELDVLAAHPELLRERVGMVTVATHSELIDRGLRRLFASLEWTARYDVPIGGSALVRVGGVSVKQLVFQQAFAPWASPVNASLAYALAYVIVWWCIMAALYAGGIRLRA